MVISDDIKATFNSMHEGILIIDPQGTIVFGNQAYLDFVNRESGVPVSEINGKKLRQLRPGAQLPEVMASGKPVLRVRRREASDVYFVNMYPIFSNNKIIGGLSVVTFLDDAEAFRSEIEAVERRNHQVLTRVSSAYTGITFDDIVAKAAKTKDCKAYAERIAATDFPILLTSENGAGKGVYAQAIHHASNRSKEVFISLNCATFRENLALELFGSESNAIPTMPNGYIGLLEASKGGTLLLDEISEMPLNVQVKLLDALHRNSIRRLGSDYDTPIDVRIIAATSIPLLDKVIENKFSPDLYYFLNTFNVRIPALRERLDDIPVLVKNILRNISQKRKQKLVIGDDALNRIMTHDWPGNISELENVLEFSAYLARDGVITSDSLPENIGVNVTRNEMSLQSRVKAFEKAEIIKTLEHYGNDLAGKKSAAQELGISLASLYSKIK